jgi:hypothetical protein
LMMMLIANDDNGVTTTNAYLMGSSLSISRCRGTYQHCQAGQQRQQQRQGAASDSELQPWSTSPLPSQAQLRCRLRRLAYSQQCCCCQYSSNSSVK